MEDLRNNFIRDVESVLILNRTAEEARDIMNIIIERLENYEMTARNTALANYDNTNEQILKFYAGSLKIAGKSEKTIAQYIRLIKIFADYCPCNLDQVDTMHIRIYLSKRMGKISDRSYLNEYRYISAFYKWMVNEVFMQTNPMGRIPNPKILVTKEAPFTKTELARIRDHVKDKKRRAVVEFLLATGVRVNELCDMEIEDVDISKKTAFVRCGKGKKSRTVYMSDLCIAYLKDYLATRNDELKPLFVTRLKEKYTTDGLRDMLKSIEKACGVEGIHPHRFRKTLATSMYESGMDVADIQKILGHSGINTTMGYITVTDDKVKNDYFRYN